VTVPTLPDAHIERLLQQEAEAGICPCAAIGGALAVLAVFLPGRRSSA
jgi:hypothetical protein